MSKYKIIITDPAMTDVRGIDAYITYELKAPEAANKLLDRIEAGILSLSKMPRKFAVVNNARLSKDSVRKFKVANYFIFFRIDEDAENVIILRVLFARRDWENIL